MRRLRLCWAVLLALAGCNSISSTLLNRTDNDVFVGNSNGEPKSDCRARPFKGVPITLRVPTHLDIAVKETIFLRPDETQKLTRVSIPKRHLFVEANLVETDKVFTVDVKRPAAGTLDYTMTFGENANGLDNTQYFAEIKSKIVDTTIKDVNTALQTVLPLLRNIPKASPTAFTGDLSDVIRENRVVAWKRFDLDAPDFEQQVGGFLELHLNCCNTCLEYRAADRPAAEGKP